MQVILERPGTALQIPHLPSLPQIHLLLLIIKIFQYKKHFFKQLGMQYHS